MPSHFESLFRPRTSSSKNLSLSLKLLQPAEAPVSVSISDDRLRGEETYICGADSSSWYHFVLIPRSLPLDDPKKFRTIFQGRGKGNAILAPSLPSLNSSFRMLRDLNIFRRNSGKTRSAEDNDENVAPGSNAVDVSAANSFRIPFNAIKEALGNQTSDSDQDSAQKRKTAKTPSKTCHKESPGPASRINDLEIQDTANLRTPEKPPLSATPVGTARNRFGWATKNDNGTNPNKSSEDSGTSLLPPLDRGTFTTPRMCKTIGRTNSFNSDCSSTQNTPNKSISRPFSSGFGGIRAPSSVNRAPNSSTCSKQNPRMPFSSSTVNTVDVPHFEMKEDPSFWMDHNVQVVIRIRPINSTERGLYGYNRCLKQDNSQSISWVGQPDSRFTFDHVACETINQEALFRVVGLPMVENCISGYNSCIFAFGQTGSGKTYTMLGEINELDTNPSSDRGMTPRIFEFLFARIRAEEESRRDENLRYTCKCSFLEIYNEQITDLLEPSSTNLLLREDTNTGVYVENLSEFQVETLSDVVKLLIKGSANRKIAATNMNRESSRSHSVLTCVIESQWEKNSTANFRFAKLNLVDLAGSERQKLSGAEGERLKEAASINKSLSTLGHVIMVLVDVARGKQRHVPYRDSRLTFLLQDSLGGNSKTMVIANISPSISCASETLSTLKFAQRAKLIQNNAVVNEDSSEDVAALHHQIKLLKEELAMLKSQNVSRSLSFRSAILRHSSGEQCNSPLSSGLCDSSSEASKSIKAGRKQLKSMEAVLSGSLRREKVADITIKQLQAEIEQLNRLVRQREEDTQGTKMMLKFREDKIQRMESLVGGFLTPESYLKEENNSLAEENQLLQLKIDRHPEVTRFALENIRLLEQLRRFQEFYEEEEREILLAEIVQLRNQALHLLEERSNGIGSKSLKSENLHSSQTESTPEVCALQIDLARTQQDLEDCRSKLECCLQSNAQLTVEIGNLQNELQVLKTLSKTAADPDGLMESNSKEVFSEVSSAPNLSEDILCLQVELDILKTIFKVEREDHSSERKQLLEITTCYEDAQNEIKEAKCIIEALESQELLLISELDEFRQMHKSSEKMVSESLKLKRREETQIREVCQQAEAETAEVIICLQDELNNLREDAQNSQKNEAFALERLSELESEIKIFQEKNLLLTQDNERLNEIIELKDDHLRSSVHEIAGILSDGNNILDDCMVDSLPLGLIKDIISERDAQIQDLRNRLDDAQGVEREMEWKLRSLRGAMLAITEAHHQENTDRERNVLLLMSELSEKKSTISVLQNDLKRSMLFTIMALAAVSQMFEKNSSYLEAIEMSELRANYSEIMLLQKDAILLDLEERVNAYEKERWRSEMQREKSAKDFISQLMGPKTYLISKERELEFAPQELDQKIQSMAAKQRDIGSPTILSKFKEAREAKQYESTLNVERDYLKCHIQELETLFTKRNEDLTYELKSVADEISGLKSQFLSLTEFTRCSWEDLWLEVVKKDCTISVLGVCYMGIIRDLTEPNSPENFGWNFPEQEQVLEQYCSQDFQACILQSELKEKVKESKVISAQLVSLERELHSLVEFFDKLKEEVIFLTFEGELKRKLLLDLEAENAILEGEAKRDKSQQREKDVVIREMQVKLEDLQYDFQQTIIREMELKNEVSQLQMEVRDSTQSSELISKSLLSKTEEIQILSKKMEVMASELQTVQREKLDVLEELLCREKELSSASYALSYLEEENHKLEDKMKTLHLLISSLENELVKKNTEIAEIANSHSIIESDLESERSRLETLTSRFDALEREHERMKNELTKSKIEETDIFTRSLRDQLATKTNELDVAMSQNQLLAEQITEKSSILDSLESNLSREITEKADLKAQLAKNTKLLDELETEIREARNLLTQKDHLLGRLIDERERVESTITMMQEKIEMTRSLAEEHEAIAMEAKQIAELKRVYAEEKEEEVRLLERSVEELECTVDMLENKVEIVKEEAEKQRLQREMLEMDMEILRDKILGLESSSDCLMMAERKSTTSLRHLDQKLCELEEYRKKIETLEKEIENKESEIIQCKAHIAELNLHAEAQARENKQRIKELEVMAQQVNPSNQVLNKQEKMAAKSRGSGSPFKCIGLGLSQQMNSEKDEELSAARSRIEELKAIAARRQKEIFMLNARLANAESMTHDVIRDLLGVKHDMSNYAALLDGHRSDDSCHDLPEKDELIVNLRERLTEFLHERERWAEEMSCTKTALESLREREQLLSADNEALRATNVKQKKAVAQMEEEVKRLQQEQNLQHRIHHHAKIKEENVSLRAKNEELTSRLKRSEEALLRLKEDLGS